MFFHALTQRFQCQCLPRVHIWSYTNWWMQGEGCAVNIHGVARTVKVNLTLSVHTGVMRKGQTCEYTESLSTTPHLPAANSTTHSCTHFSCHGDNLFVRSRLLEICPSDLVNVRVAGRAVVPQGVQGFVWICECVRIQWHGWWDLSPCQSVSVSLVFGGSVLWRRKVVQGRNRYICTRQCCNLNLIACVLILVLFACIHPCSFSSSWQLNQIYVSAHELSTRNSK